MQPFFYLLKVNRKFKIKFHKTTMPIANNLDR